MKTEITSLAQISSAISKIVVGALLVFSGFGFVGIMTGFVLSSIIMDILLIAFSARILRGNPYSFQLSLLKDLITASTAGWIPSLLASLGQSIGVLFVFGFVGGAETGFYYLALAIASIINMLPASIQGMMYPYLSSREEGRKEATRQMIRISMVISTPLVLVLFTYSLLPFAILGPAYYPAAELLRILILTSLLSPIVAGYVSHVYACGEYRHVAAIGSVMNVSRLFLYFILVTALYAVGAAISYTLGMILALVAVAGIGRTIDFEFNWSKYGAAISIPIVCAIPLLFFNVHFLVGIPLLIIIPMLAYGRLGLITKSDLRDLAPAFMSKEQIAIAQELFNPIMRIVFGE